MASQAIFERCYRNRQKPIHHMAYMRMGKVLLLLRLLEQAGIQLADKKVFDYGFGAGTFFRYCPPSASLFGVEIDPENVAAVAQMLASRAHPKVDLQVIDVDHWQDHPLFNRQYDVIVCSHVLEHLDDPVALLLRFRGCLAPGGMILGLVPINERVTNPHHVLTADRSVVASWADASGLRLREYMEEDPWFYWGQFLFATDHGWKHRVTQAFSLGFGVPATLLGQQRWAAASRLFAMLTRSKPTQAGFVLE